MRSCAKPALASAWRACSTSSWSWKCPAMMVDICIPPRRHRSMRQPPAEFCSAPHAALLPLSVDNAAASRFHLEHRLRTPFSRVDPVILDELVEQGRMARAKPPGLLEETLGRDREELGRAGRAIMVEN